MIYVVKLEIHVLGSHIAVAVDCFTEDIDAVCKNAVEPHAQISGSLVCPAAMS